MKLSDFKIGEGGEWEWQFDGCSYPDAASVVSSGLLGFCGCGCPESALVYVRSALQLIEDKWNYDLTQQNWLEVMDSDEYKKWYESHENAEKSLFGSEGAKYFMWYWLDGKGYTEHGSSVPGWLTDSGRDLLALLNEIEFED